MTPETILQAITAVAEAVTEMCKLAQTVQGQASIEKALKDQAAVAAAFKGAREWLEKLFTGKL
jgi:hypothetical protein